MKHFLLFYEYGEDFGARRSEFRSAHLEYAWHAANRGELLLAGALTEPMDQGILLLHGEDKSTADSFATNDPYVRAGLILKWTVREWVTTVGEAASNPTRSGS